MIRALYLAVLAISASAQAQQPNAETLSNDRVCIEAGRVLRDKVDPKYKDAVTARAIRENFLTRAEIAEIAAGQLKIGMHGCQVMALLGQPERSNKTVTSSGTRHQLVYSGKIRYVYMVNQIVTAWQE